MILSQLITIPATSAVRDPENPCPWCANADICGEHGAHLTSVESIRLHRTVERAYVAMIFPNIIAQRATFAEQYVLPNRLYVPICAPISTGQAYGLEVVRTSEVIVPTIANSTIFKGAVP